jgi:hypothetical protein
VQVAGRQVGACKQSRAVLAGRQGRAVKQALRTEQAVRQVRSQVRTITQAGRQVGQCRQASR